MYDKAKINATDRQTISYSYYWVNNFICFFKNMIVFNGLFFILLLHIYMYIVHSNMSILQRIPTKNIKSYALTSSQIKIENIIFIFFWI